MLYEPPRTALDEVAAAITLLPFSNSMLPLFQLITPYCNLPNISLAVDDLLARIAILELGLNIA